MNIYNKKYTQMIKSSALIFLVFWVSNAAFAQAVFVSLDGNDNNQGTKDAPFQNIQAAIEKTAGKPTTIWLRGGLYQIGEPIQIHPENSGLKIKAYNRENVVLSAAKSLSNWKEVKHPSPGNDRPKKVWKTKLEEGHSILTLYNEHGILPRCASPKFKTFERDVQMEEGGNLEGKSNSERIPTDSKMYYRKGQIDHVKSFEGAEIFILPRFDWVANYLPVKSVNREECFLETICPGTYELSTPPTWTQIELFYRLENVPEFLDKPGEWYFNKKSGELYLITNDGKEPKNILAPQMDHIINIAGDLEQGNFVKNIGIEGITFQHAERMTWENGRIGVQHDWEVVDGDWACIKAKGVNGLTVQNCLFDNSGGDGVRIDLEGWDNDISNNEFSNLGGSAVSLIGYAVGTHDKLHNNRIANNYIHHCANLWWLQGGITICQSSTNLVTNNLIHDMPYNAIALVGGRSAFFGQGRESNSIADGLSYVNWDEIPEEVNEWYEKIGYISTRDNVVEHNEIHNVVTTLGDGNAVYLSGVGSGNILQKNYIHHMPSLSSAGGLRFDNDTWYCTMRNNVVWNANSSSVDSKGVNNVENNILINSGVRPSLNLGAGPKWGSNIRRNIVVNNRQLFESTMNKWMKLEDIFAKGELNQCIITGNVFFVSDDAGLGKRVTGKINENLNAADNRHADPLFYDLQNGDFRLKEHSSALKMGFIPFDDYGLTGPVGRKY
jgi:hypothetical protein